jgi:pimeloyl-ACP methyl ester carboxylesterase
MIRRDAFAMVQQPAITNATPPGDGVTPSTDGQPIHYHVEGRGEPPLVFVHGWACDRHLWDEQVAAFAPRHRVVALDLAGHGESGRGRTEWTVPAFGEDVAAVVEALDLRGAVLIAHSLGGPVVLEAATRISERVAALVPIDTLLDVGETHTAEEVDAFLAPFRTDYPRASADFVRKWMFLPASDPALVERMAARAASNAPDIAIDVLRHVWLYDPRPALRQVKAPIRALNSDRYPTRLDAARAEAPRFDAVVMTGVAHYLMLEDPRRFDRLLGEIIATVGNARPDSPPQGARRP